MSMEISSNYGSYYNNTVYNSRANEQTEKTKTEKVQSSKEKVEEYYQKLCKKFPEISFNTSGGELRCNSNKVVVNLSYECLKKMANDPEFAKEIEYNLSGEVQANAMTYGWAKRDGVELGGRIVTYDAEGNRTSSCGGMRTANAGNSSVSKTLDKSDSIEERIRKKREEKEEMEARLDEKTAQWLEYNLSLIPETVEKTKAMVEARGAKVISHSIKINGYDSMTAELCTRVEADPGTEKARENLEKKLEKIREEKKEEKKRTEEKIAEKRAEKTAESADKFELTFTGSSVESIAQIMTERMVSGNTSASMTSGLDLKV